MFEPGTDISVGIADLKVRHVLLDFHSGPGPVVDPVGPVCKVGRVVVMWVPYREYSRIGGVEVRHDILPRVAARVYSDPVDTNSAC